MKMRCPGCNGDGQFWTECCNGAGGCSCRGQIINLGSCRVCGGSGQVEPDQMYDSEANLRAIRGLHFIGSGPQDGSWPNTNRGHIV